MGTGAEGKSETAVSRMIEDVVGCKWSMAVLASVRSGLNRPGAIERHLPGLATKVLNERLRKLVRYGILTRVAFPEVPPRVEYQLTPFGQRFIGILDLIDQLQSELSQPRTKTRM